ncbi:MAG: UvrY/SirA/GacA family response regulator transcription factor [Nitrococcus mobilis]|nr:UvrY/SirA/GacA family response regulator transcription factor [Nitrococcus mobilis]
MIRVVLVDDHQLVRTGIRRILSEAEEVEVIGEADSGEQALDVIRQLQPDVVLMDVYMPGIGGLEATRKLLRIAPTLKILALSVYGNEPYPSRLLEAGALGYLTKDCSAQDMLSAIRTIARGERYICSRIARQMALSGLEGQSKNPFAKLSQREIQVMMMITEGLRLHEISETLCLSPKTVSTYRYRLYEKLGVGNDVELTRLAIRFGMIEKT